MHTKLLAQPAAEVETEALIVLGLHKDDPRTSSLWATLNQLTGGWLEELYASGEFKGKPGDLAMLYRPPGLKARRLLVAGCGKAEKLTPAEVRRAVGTAARYLKPRSVRNAAVALDETQSGDDYVSAAVEGALLADFEADRYKTEEKDSSPLESFAVVLPQPGAEDALARGRVVAESQNYARSLVSEPANRLTPMRLAECARGMAAESGLDCEVLDQDRLRQLGMGALLGVAQGSAEPPCLIVVRYRPPGAAKDSPHLGFIGKGVTFDTGGISIKPSEGMDRMKSDMAGGAAVLGALRALAVLKPPVSVTALVPAVENMPGSRAQRPGDIVTSLSGKTIEILNTDAEGRLILADAITYAQRLGCTHLIDLATLTGAIVVALGHVHVGVFGSDPALVDKILAAAKAQGEKMWPMPVDDEYREALKSPFADIANVGSRWGGAVSAAMFLKEFAGDTPWAHLDIAGTAWLEEAKPALAKGPTGVGVRTLVHLAMNW